MRSYSVHMRNIEDECATTGLVMRKAARGPWERNRTKRQRRRKTRHCCYH